MIFRNALTEGVAQPAVVVAAPLVSSPTQPPSPAVAEGDFLNRIGSPPESDLFPQTPRQIAEKFIRAQLIRARTNWKASIAGAAVLIVLLATTRVGGSSYDHWGSPYVDSSGRNPYSAKALSLPGMRMGLEPGRAVRLSRSLGHLAYVGEPMQEGDVPLFFHIPRSGGSTMKDIMGMCLGMVEASDVGSRHGHKFDQDLQVMTSEDGSHFVNVDTTTAEGIHRAKRLGLIESRLADVVVTQLLHPAATMFSKTQRGRMFTFIRHPIERAVSLFHYLGVADWEPTYDPDLAYISIEMYARSKRIEHNWMVRFLSNELERDLTTKHLAVAKEVLRQKCLVGLLTDKGETFMRLERYFGWAARRESDPSSKECQERLLHWGWSNKHAHPIVEVGSPAWQLLLKKNSLDMQLYEFAKELFAEQGALFREGGTFAPDATGAQEAGAAGQVVAGGER
uniref:Sulfotransferase domain-containing protein n=1 Tax=Odontella aurita TaxID=265563 RepID=A0A7S4MGW3_9STRA|mmetsp:Transcript_21295/g.61978  ORF Transcript_21295/g.61978 Transcript_21295/m.61978 type:complete len:451 (+) Transcript_21295:140-1492(+)